MMFLHDNITKCEVLNYLLINQTNILSIFLFWVYLITWRLLLQRMKFFLSILAAAVLATSEADALSSPAYRRLEEANSGAKRSWWQLGLADDILNEVRTKMGWEMSHAVSLQWSELNSLSVFPLDKVGLYYLGQAWYGSADVGEVLETISRVNASDPWSWTMHWRKTAERLEALAIESANAGKKIYT